MDSLLKQKIIRSAKHSWDTGDLIEAGRLLFERIPCASRPFWGADILEFASQRVSKAPDIQNVITFARTPEEWANSTSREKRSNAHDFFNAVRQITLEEDRKDNADQVYRNVLLLAENVAKVTYNAYGYHAPFDHDAGWWVVSILKNVVDLVNDTDFSTTAWKVLTNEAYIELETPTRCNPYCTTCNNGLQTFERK